MMLKKRVIKWIYIWLMVVAWSGCQLGPSQTASDSPNTPAEELLAIEADSTGSGKGKAEEQMVDEETSDETNAEAESRVLRVGDLLNTRTESQEEAAELTIEADGNEATLIDAEAAPEVASEVRVFEIGNELTIAALKASEIVGSEITIEQTLTAGTNYSQNIASYISEGNRIYGLLTVPFGEPPANGFGAVVFNHGFIPPAIYQTTERYVVYVDALARSGLVVFKIDLRGHGNSEGEPSGTYFSPAYTIDAISALKSLQTLDFVNPQGIGMWGHSMAGNLVLRAMLVEPDVKAGVIWAGAVYSYDDFVRYSIADPSFNRRTLDESPIFRRTRAIREAYGEPNTAVPYWRAVSLTENLNDLQAPVQLHHALNDDVVNSGYSVDLAAILAAEGKSYELYTYEGGGHNIGSPYFNEAMQRTIAFFKTNL
ncbi:MAG: alpha/beta fold hydrolase [Chloroflexota bacterium]